MKSGEQLKRYEKITNDRFCCCDVVGICVIFKDIYYLKVSSANMLVTKGKQVFDCFSEVQLGSFISSNQINL